VNNETTANVPKHPGITDRIIETIIWLNFED